MKKILPFVMILLLAFLAACDSGGETTDTNPRATQASEAPTVSPGLSAANVIDRQAIVVGVNRPGDSAFDALTVNNGDKVQFTKYAPANDDLDVRIVAGATYNMFMLTQGDNAQAFIVWSPDDPVWQDKLSTANTVVAGIGSPGPNTLMRGDNVHISVQDAEGGGTDVTLDVWRNNAAVATFSFVVSDGASAIISEPVAVIAGDEVSPAIEPGGVIRSVDVSMEPAATIANSGGYFHLQTMFLEDQNKCLEGQGGVAPGSGAVLDGSAFMNDCQDVTGQLWKITPANGGYYNLQNMIGEEMGLCLEGNQYPAGSALNGAAFMNSCTNASGQLWKFVESGAPGYYRLQTAFLESENKCLEGNQYPAGSVLSGAAFMDNCYNVTGQLWKLVPVGEVSAPAEERQPTTLLGQVVDATTAQSLTTAQVCVQNTTRCVTVDSSGNYALTDLSTTELTLEVTAPGHIPVAQSVTIVANETTIQNFALSPEIVDGDLRIVLTWGESPLDLDSHLVIPGGEANLVNFWGQGSQDEFPFAILDVDDRDGYGPETITIKERQSGVYIFTVHNYSGNGSFDGARVQVYGATGLIAEYTPPAGRQDGFWWYVFDMDGDSARLTEVNRIQTEAPY